MHDLSVAFSGAALSDPLVLLGMAEIAVEAVLGIIVIALLCALLRRTRGPARSDAPQAAPAPAVHAPPPTPAGPPPDRQAMIAAISAAIAEEMGTDVSAIRIVSVKQL